MLPSRRTSGEVDNDDATLFVVSADVHEDDVSLLSMDQSVPSTNASTNDLRFGTSSHVKKYDVTPKPPRRRFGSNDSVNKASTHTSSTSGSWCTIPTNHNDDSVSHQLESLLGMVNNLGMQLSAMQGANQTPDVNAQEDIRLLRQQLDEERRARESAERKLVVERDISMTVKAELALTNVMNSMKQNVQVIQDQKKTTRARRALLDIVDEFGEGGWLPSSCAFQRELDTRKSITAVQNSTCYTIPELESVETDFDSSSLSRESSRSRGSSSDRGSSRSRRCA